jgi:hypothetical protein
MRIIAQLIGTLLLVGFVLKYWWLIALTLAAVAAWKYVPKVWAARQAALAAEQRRHAAIAARADQQHQCMLAGDPRGTYGADFSGSKPSGTGASGYPGLHLSFLFKGTYRLICGGRARGEWSALMSVHERIAGDESRTHRQARE